jgi:twitching motility two-component system response regulator PilH
MSMSRILVVDDSPTVLYVVKQMLAEGGYEALAATDGEDALRLASQARPSLILLDLILPKVNGYEVCRQLKSAPETAHIPVVMVTSKTRDADREWGIEQGADDYVTKPFDAQNLLEVIGRFVPQAG